MIERWEKGGELKKVKGCGREERRQERETDSMTRDGREGGEREDGGAKKLRDEKTGVTPRSAGRFPNVYWDRVHLGEMKQTRDI